MKLIITEEERSRILGMYQSTTARQYLMEEVTGPQITDSAAAFKYFNGLSNAGKLVKGSIWLGKNTYWIITSDGQPASNGYIYEFKMRGITKRNGLYFDVSNENESLSGQMGNMGGAGFSITFTGDATQQWDAGLQTIKPMDQGGTPGGNMGLVGGLANFKTMVNGLPSKQSFLVNYNKAKQGPNFKNAVPQDQMDLYGSTTQPQKPGTVQPQKP